MAPVRTGMQAGGVAVLASTDEDEARAALDRAVKGSGKPFSARTYKDVRYQVNDEGGAAAVTGDFVVLGSEAELKRTLDVLDGGRALAGDDRYKKALEPLAGDRLGTAYFDLKALFAAAAAQNPAASAQFQQLNRIVPMNALGPLAVGFTADGDRLAAESAFGGIKAYRDRFGAGSAPLIQGLPGDSWLAVGLPNFGVGFRSGYDSAVGSLGGAALEQQLKSQTGLDLRQDVFSWIGDVAFFMRGDSKDTVNGAAVISVTDEAAAWNGFGKLVGVVQSQGGVRARPVPVKGAESAFAFAAPGSPEPVVAARSKDKVVIAFGEDAAADALSPSQTMAGSPTYEAAKAALGDGIEPGFLLAMPPVVSLLGSTAKDKAEFAQAKPYLDAFAVIAAGAKQDGDTARGRVVAGLR